MGSHCCNLEERTKVRKLEKSIAAFESEDQRLVVEVLKVYENSGKDATTSYILCAHRKLEGSYGLDVSAEKEALKYVTSYEKSLRNSAKLTRSFT
jgi:hypothetical protein